MTRLRLAEFLIAAALALAIFLSWRADRRDRAQLAADLAAAHQSLAQATARQHNRDAQLAQTLSAIATQKRTAATPAQILRDLPNHLPLPARITLGPNVGAQHAAPQLAQAKSESSDSADRDATFNRIDAALLPVADLKPIYDFALDCQACQAKLSAAQSDLADERIKTATLTRERNEAVRTAKGGSTFRRIARAAKWFALGAAAGAMAATAHR